MRINKTFFNRIIIIAIFLFFPISAFMQEVNKVAQKTNPVSNNIVSLEDIKSIANKLEIYHGGFISVRKEFFANQTEGNKARYHLAGVDWGVQLLDTERQYINYIEPVLYNSLLVKNISQNWLESDRKVLANTSTSIKNTENYIDLKSIIQKYITSWNNTKKKINQVRLLKAIEPFTAVVQQARFIHDKLQAQQKSVASQLKVAAIEPVDWSKWEKVFVTYSESLDKVENILNDISGNIDNPRNFTSFDTEDLEWNQVLERIGDLKAELKVLSVLQESSIREFEGILNSTVTPVNKPIPTNSK